MLKFQKSLEVTRLLEGACVVVAGLVSSIGRVLVC